MGSAKTFSLGQVLSVSHDRLMCDMSQVYEILNHMTQDSLFTHQLPRAQRECRPWLLRWFPQLSDLDLSDVTPENQSQRLAEVDMELRNTLDPNILFLPSERMPLAFKVEPIPRDDHIWRDPIEEMAEMMGGLDRVIVVEMRGTDGG